MRRNPPTPPDLRDHAREMRHEGTDAEARLWSGLRDRRLSGFKFRRQHPCRGFILDFYCAEARLAVELDGGQHSEPEQAERDRRRTEVLERDGILVLRFWDVDALRETDSVLETIYHALAARVLPHPSPLPEGEGTEGARGVRTSRQLPPER